MRSVEGGDVYRVPLANIDLNAANLTETEKRVNMLRTLVFSGFSPEDALKALGLPEIAHTGVPSTQLQPLQNVNPDDPASVYP
jgi:hypothetical protein